MRSWLAVFLLVLLPLQFSWAGVDATTSHDCTRPGAAHCLHPHCTADALDMEAGTGHADCGTCHNGCPIALFGEPRPEFTGTPAFSIASATLLPASRPSDLPDRPQWSARG